MAGTMSEADLALDLKASLQDAASVFTAAASGDFKRHLACAALAFAFKRPRTLVGTVTLVADQPDYAAPAGFHAFGSSLWGIAPRAKVQPWDKCYPGRLPNLKVIETANDPAVVRKLYLDPPPTSAQISALGSEFRFYYYGNHVISADAAKTTIAAGDRGLLLLRAQAEAMRELAARNIAKPVIMREGMGSQARNGTPSYLYEKLMEEFGMAA
jgi:hypothetical protein